MHQLNDCRVNMKFRMLGMAVVLVIAMLGGIGVVAANHDGGEQCDRLDNATDAINEHADENAQENNSVDRAKSECEGDHFQDEANDASDNAQRGGNQSEDGGSDNGGSDNGGSGNAP